MARVQFLDGEFPHASDTAKKKKKKKKRKKTNIYYIKSSQWLPDLRVAGYKSTGKKDEITF